MNDDNTNKYKDLYTIDLTKDAGKYSTITLDDSWLSSSLAASTTKDILNISGGNYTYSTTASGWGTNWNNSSSVNIDGNGIDIKESGDIKIGHRSLKEFMEKMEQRLAILQPDPELLDKFEALKQAYEHYKTLEALCMGDIPKKPDGK